MRNCPDDYISRWFSVFHRLYLSFVYEGLKEYNIGSGQIMFLLELYYCDGVSQEELSSYLSIDGANTTRAINKLEKEGYVIRKQDEKDRRVKRIYLTKKAMDIKPKVLGLINQWESLLLENLTKVEKQVLNDLLKKIGHARVENNRCQICEKDCSK
ncbi:MAG: MarR family transcriptional regulator [Tissierellia bacterium]|nr:MarR family transcriptional regulator [Tissierellia bacterium]